jgi:uncharacterized protein (TIGR02246 family)
MTDAIATPSTPTEVVETLSRLMSDGDVEGALSLYEPDAVFQPSRDAPAVTGRPSIREALLRFVALRPTLTGDVVKVHQAGDTALVVNRWTLVGTQPDGEPVEMAGISADVLRRESDGHWRIAVDDPWGAG